MPIGVIAALLIFSSCEKSNPIDYNVLKTSPINSEASVFDTSELRNGLIAYYPFSGNADDLSGHDHNGTIYNVSLTKDRHGISKAAYYFNGHSSNIKVPTDSELNLKGSFSISSWFNMSHYATDYNGSMILSKHDGNRGGNGYIYCILNPDHDTIHQHLLFQANGIWGVSPNPKTYIQTNSWYNYTITFNKKSDSLRYYLNGVLVSSQYAPIKMIGNKFDLTIGYSTSSREDHDFFNGAIDDIRMYNRVLTRSEIQYLSNH